MCVCVCNNQIIEGVELVMGVAIDCYEQVPTCKLHSLTEQHLLFRSRAALSGECNLSETATSTM